jgi:hypothetical protein
MESVLLTQELKPIDVGCGIVSVDVHGLRQILGRREPASRSEGDGELCNLQQSRHSSTTKGHQHIIRIETVITTNLKKLSELDRQDTTSGHVCESPRDLIHRWAQGSKE